MKKNGFTLIELYDSNSHNSDTSNITFCKGWRTTSQSLKMGNRLL